MANKPFKFKQFSVQQDRCAMKIGTDAVLLGAWTSLQNKPHSILDIGTGTGVLALMLAQRSQADLIDALEIDDAAYEQCVDNFENSPWSDRLFCYHASLAVFTEEIEDQYDLIISNPPFYSENYKAQNEQRDLARHTDAMPFEHLFESASKLLSEKGIFSVIVPFSEENRIINFAQKFNLFPIRILNVRGNPSSKTVRSLMEFSFQKNDISTHELIIENERHNYSQDYVSLTKDFYLKM